MGEARRRGTWHQRRAAAIKQQKRALVEALGGHDARDDKMLRSGIEPFLERMPKEQWAQRRSALIAHLKGLTEGTELVTCPQLPCHPAYLHLSMARIHPPVRSITAGPPHPLPSHERDPRRRLPGVRDGTWLCTGVVGSPLRDRLSQAPSEICLPVRELRETGVSSQARIAYMLVRSNVFAERRRS